MSKKHNVLEVSAKSTKEQILAAYNEVLTKLTEKQLSTPQEQKKQEEEQNIIKKTASHSPDNILTDLSNLKSKTIKQIDGLSEQLLSEFQKLANLRQAITIEQKHLEELYQINETANTLSALLQTQAEQKQQFKLDMELSRQNFEQEMATQKLQWQEQKSKLEQEYKERKELLEKIRKREEEEYGYALELKQRKEMDEYNDKKFSMEKELSDLKDNLSKREADLLEKEKDYESLRLQVQQIPDKIKEAVTNNEKALEAKLLEQYEFATKLKQQEYDGILKLKEQSINYLEEKIRKQDDLIKELSEKADMATQQVQSIACRALDTSAQRFLATTNKVEEKA